LILTGELDDVGAPIRKIVETVIVLDWAWRYYCDHDNNPNMTISTNKNKDFSQMAF
jgi:hypothetical protein